MLHSICSAPLCMAANLINMYFHVQNTDLPYITIYITAIFHLLTIFLKIKIIMVTKKITDV